MTAPTNQHLLTDYPLPSTLVETKTGTQEIWAIDTQFLVLAGTNMEQLVADMYDGKTADPNIQTPIRGIRVTRFTRVSPEPTIIEETSNPFLVSMFSYDLLSRVDSSNELWNVTSQYLVEAGTDVQQMLADSVQGKFADLDPKMSPNCKAIVPISDIVKIK